MGGGGHPRGVDPELFICSLPLPHPALLLLLLLLMEKKAFEKLDGRVTCLAWDVSKDREHWEQTRQQLEERIKELESLAQDSCMQ